MKLKKLISDVESVETVDIVGNSYILLETEEWIYSPHIAEQFYFSNRIDYIRFRKYCKILAESVWETMNAENRHICIDNYVKPTAVSWDDIDYTDEELFNYWVRMVELEKDCRIERMNKCIEKITWYFTGEESMAAYTDIKGMMNDWKQCEYPELYFFVNSLAGTILGLTFDYTATGYASKSYYTLDRLNLVNEILFLD